MIRRKHLEILLSGISDFERPRADLEQYITPAHLVCEILFLALENDDIIAKRVLELGCGPAPFALGAWLLGSSHAAGADIDKETLAIAERNMSLIKERSREPPPGKFDLFLHDVKDVEWPFGKFDTILMNPPFGAQDRNADRPFIEKAVNVADVVYSIHNGNSLEFLKKMSASMNVRLDPLFRTDIIIPSRFDFHRRERVVIDVIVVRFYK